MSTGQRTPPDGRDTQCCHKSDACAVPASTHTWSTTTVERVGHPLRFMTLLTAGNSKASILARLGLPLVSVALTCYQMPHVMNQHFSQGTRSLMASLDILVATIVSNAIVLLSLLQDRGYKKRRYRAGTQTELPSKGPFDAGRRRSESSPAQTKWGSNENLVSILETDSDGNPNMIRMGTIKNSKKSRSSQDKRSVEDLHEPERVRLQDIRIASTWEVSITQK